MNFKILAWLYIYKSKILKLNFNTSFHLPHNTKLIWPMSLFLGNLFFFVAWKEKILDYRVFIYYIDTIGRYIYWYQGSLDNRWCIYMYTIIYTPSIVKLIWFKIKDDFIVINYIVAVPSKGLLLIVRHDIPIIGV